MGRDSSSHATNSAQSNDDEQLSRRQPDVAAAPNGENGRAPAGDQAHPHSQNRSDESERAGQDERRRGWFWHWNGIVTQYTPLIGLKGIGLLNSYTVWTDRREDSPHRGYAFPSQQSEASFYGEDRAELITINKILVALDLIEIRKEMIRKVDAQGRRWKVPQNLYRVKDRQNGLDLTAADVLRVIELAERDQAVYRYIRKLFSSKFEPIDRDSVWHRILAELDGHPTWRKLAVRAAKQEEKASARASAGHRARAGKQDGATPGTDDTASGQQNGGEIDVASDSGIVLTSGHIDEALSSDAEQRAGEVARDSTSAGPASNGFELVDERTNRASGAVDEPTNDGFEERKGGSVAGANNGRESSVEQGNTTYYKSSTTTTTTTGSLEVGADQEQVDGETPAHADAPVAVTPLAAGAAGARSAAPQRGLADQPGAGPLGDPSALVVSLYEAANDRLATRLERVLLSELEQDAAAAAAAAGSSGPEWVAAALREAVGSGSAFVAPKRIREIINRWSADGAGPRGASLNPEVRSGDIRHADGSVDESASKIKQLLEEMLGTQIEGAVLADDKLRIVIEDGRLEEVERARHLIERRLSAELDRPLRLVLDTSSSGPPPARDVLKVSRADMQQGEQLWSLVLDLLAAEGAGAELARLQGVVPLGQREDGAFLLGTPTRLAARLLSGRYRPAVEHALSALLSFSVRIETLDQCQWAATD